MTGNVTQRDRSRIGGEGGEEMAECHIDVKVGATAYKLWAGEGHSMNFMKLVIPLHSLYWSIHTKDESKRATVGVN